MKDFLLEVKNRVAVHEKEFVARGVQPALLELPARVLAAVEGGAADVAREKAEDSLARANAATPYRRLVDGLDAAWAAAGLVSAQALLMMQMDDATPEQKKTSLQQADEAGALLVMLDKVLGEAKVEAQKRATVEKVPADLVDGTPTPPSAEPAAPADEAKTA